MAPTHADFRNVASWLTPSGQAYIDGDIQTRFGGYKMSGSFARDCGTEALGQNMQTKTIWIAT
ncbi:MAG: hypothetical protein WBA91_06090 [Paracoccaceae bacterium]